MKKPHVIITDQMRFVKIKIYFFHEIVEIVYLNYNNCQYHASLHAVLRIYEVEFWILLVKN